MNQPKDYVENEYQANTVASLRHTCDMYIRKVQKLERELVISNCLAGATGFALALLLAHVFALYQGV